MFQDRVAIITGSSSGIGAETALQMARQGGKVVINYASRAEAADEVAQACVSAGGEAIVIQADVAKDEACQKLAKAAEDKWGRIDILINNAGRTKFADHGDLDKLQPEDFIDIYKLNLIGNFLMIRAVAPAMKALYDRSGGTAGSVVNVSSIAGVAGIGSSVAYAASKGAVNTMTFSLARALAPAIRMNAICPGFVGTSWFLDRFGQETFDRIVADQEASTPLKRAGRPEDIAGPILFFAGPNSAHVTGETLLVDAGMHLDLFKR
ncbi:MAG: glucose 1-dehydrogenase [Alphaproteobacteria bacterium]|nr:MAG: glucose 1-dehydrogenase [Alphaproteobacteria bacterium]